MKKLVAFISSLLVLSAAVFADVSVKKLDDGKVEVTFFYGNPRATEVLVAGDFTNWQEGALPMTKTDKGFTLTQVVPAGTVMKYKFISDGNWTEDLREPDKVDDGFGGHNGLVDVDELVAAQGGGDAAPAKKANIKFLTWSMLGGQVKFEDNKVESAGVSLTSYVKFAGDALPGMPIYVEVALAEQKGFDNLYRSDLSIKDGALNMLVDTIFDPIYFYGGQEKTKTYLGHFKFGFDTPWVNYTTGYKYAKLPPHTNVNWTTVDKEWEAGYAEVGGFSQFDFAPALRAILGDTGVEANAVVIPNRSADRAGNRYGMIAYANAKFNTGDFGHYVDVQYNGAYGTEFNKIFDTIYEADVIAGYQGLFGPFTAKANYLMNAYGSTKIDDHNKSYFAPSTSDVGFADDEIANKIHNMAANVSGTFSNDYVTATIGGRFRGKQAGMMYVEEGSDDHTNISDQLGNKNHWRGYVDAKVNVMDGLTAGLSGNISGVLDKKEAAAWANDKDDLQFVFVPEVSVDLDEFIYVPVKLSAYGKMGLSTKAQDKFVFDHAALTSEVTFDTDVIKNLKSVFVFDNRSEDAMFLTLTNDADMIWGLTAQAGCSVRIANEGKTVKNMFGAYAGVKKQLSVLYKPTVYCQVLYGMDPYNEFNDGPTAYRLDADELTFKDGVSDYDGNTAIRIGLQWDL